MAQSGFPQNSGIIEGLTDSSELPVHKLLAHVRAQLTWSDRGAFYKAVYPRDSAEKQGMYVTMDKYLQAHIYIQMCVYIIYIYLQYCMWYLSFR